MNSDRFAELAMAETQGSLCDKLTIVKLKQWRTRQDAKRASLASQETQLQQELDRFVSAASAGLISSDRTRCIDAIDAQLLELVDKKEQMV